MSLFGSSDGVEAFFWFDDPLEAIRLGLTDEDLDVRKLAAGGPWLRMVAACTELLADIGPPAAPAVPALRPLVTDDYDIFRRYAAETLGSIGPAAASAIGGLIQAISLERDEDGSDRLGSEARHAAVVAMCKILGLDSEVEAAFLEVASHPYVRRRLCDALRDLEPETVRIILEQIRGRYGGIRE